MQLMGGSAVYGSVADNATEPSVTHCTFRSRILPLHGLGCSWLEASRVAHWRQVLSCMPPKHSHYPLEIINSYGLK
jgi:hypothetical protein